MTAAIRTVIRMDTLEWISMLSLPVWLLAQLFMGPRDHSRLGASLVEMCHKYTWSYQLFGHVAATVLKMDYITVYNTWSLLSCIEVFDLIWLI